uniref:Putative secreted protein n=1 Tax=Ixodes ricinus TaxID=34613 RepID=A0A6B0UEA9_IXORI
MVGLFSWFLLNMFYQRAQLFPVVRCPRTLLRRISPQYFALLYEVSSDSYFYYLTACHHNVHNFCTFLNNTFRLFAPSAYRICVRERISVSTGAHFVCR